MRWKSLTRETPTQISSELTRTESFTPHSSSRHGGASRDLPAGDRRIGTGGPGWKIKCETKGNPHTHEVGALSMAHAGKDTGGSQFFMVLSEQNTKHLNGVHTVFGKIIRGLDVMQQIQPNDTMTSVRVA